MSDSIEALTEILQQHIGCYSDDRSRERCVVHGTDWPCEALTNLVDEVQAWAETYPPEDGEHGRIDEETRPPDDCPYGPDCEPSQENCCDGCASGLGPCYGPGLHLVCLTHEGENE